MWRKRLRRRARQRHRLKGGESYREVVRSEVRRRPRSESSWVFRVLSIVPVEEPVEVGLAAGAETAAIGLRAGVGAAAGAGVAAALIGRGGAAGIPSCLCRLASNVASCAFSVVLSLARTSSQSPWMM